MKQKKTGKHAVKSPDFSGEKKEPKPVRSTPSLPVPVEDFGPSRSYVVKETDVKRGYHKKPQNYFLGETCPDLQTPKQKLPMTPAMADLERRIVELETLLWAFMVEDRARKLKRDNK